MAARRYFPIPCVTGYFENDYGYRQAAPVGSWTVGDGMGPIRTHDGFAVFATEQQAAWVCELMGQVRSDGKTAAQATIREALGLNDAFG